MNEYVIWSHKHGQWWAPNREGYTPNLSHAGRYSEAEAGDIVVNVIPPGTNVAMRVPTAEHFGDLLLAEYQDNVA